MDNVLIYSVWPVIVENSVVACVLERSLAGWLYRRPMQSFMLDEMENRAKCSFQMVDKLHVAFQVAWRTLKQVVTVDLCYGSVCALHEIVPGRSLTDNFLHLSP